MRRDETNTARQRIDRSRSRSLLMARMSVDSSHWLREFGRRWTLKFSSLCVSVCSRVVTYMIQYLIALPSHSLLTPSLQPCSSCLPSLQYRIGRGSPCLGRLVSWVATNGGGRKAMVRSSDGYYCYRRDREWSGFHDRWATIHSCS